MIRTFLADTKCSLLIKLKTVKVDKSSVNVKNN